MQRAKDAFVILTDGMYRVVRRGEEFEEDDPIVEANPNMFEPYIHVHPPTSPGGPATVEQATAAPSEKRKR
jgi:hypothetical protein